MKIALTDMDIVWEDKEANKKKCAAMIEEAAGEKADMILFPEMTLTGFSMNVDKVADKDGETMDFFTALAVEHEIVIGFGYASKPDDKGRNHFAVVDTKGSVLMDFVKLHPFTYGGEASVYMGGDKLGQFELPDQWRCAGFVCYDLRFPESFQKLPDTDAIFIIANWPESRIHQWYAMLQSRAIEMQSYVVGINRTGKGDGIRYTKSSAAYAPKGREIAATEKEGCQNRYIEIDWKTRRRYVEKFPVRRDRRQGIDY